MPGAGSSGVEWVMYRNDKSVFTAATMSDDDSSVELSRHRTGMSLQRTRMSADRTLMAVIRTSLSLITFGFTIFQFFRSLRETDLLTGTSHGARNFGLALVSVGVAFLILGIGYHVAFMLRVRRERKSMVRAGLVHPDTFPASMTLMVAVALLLIGVLAAISMWFRVGPFH